METYENTDPLPNPLMTVGLAYNLKKGIESVIEDIEAEYDSIETILAIKEALERLQCKVELLEADSGIFHKLLSTKLDIVFNIAEGIHGRGREAQVPAILNFLKIPFVGSDETTLCLSLDKALSKRFLSTYKIKTPRYKIFNSICPNTKVNLKFPVIVKPNAEGSSKGISDIAVAENHEELRQLIEKNISAYCQSVLVEEFIQGREFTVAIVGNGGETLIFPPMEIKYKNRGQKYNIYSFNVKKNYKEYVDYICPADLDKSAEKKMKVMAGKIYRLLECKDFSRVDFRMAEDGEIYFIEINPLPGLAPGYSDYPMITQFNGVGYTDTIKMILNSALKRYGIKQLI
ncbi:MAG TPA: ATP-grasp domain-containing protein [Clostridiaceae bacterium]|nr:ATP-grasp domain-containing protein [Clostridiaceae bacterium]